MNVKILLADDHPLFRAGVRQILERCPGNLVIEETGDGDKALEKIIELKPGIAVLDIRMPNKSGLEVLEYLYERSVPTKVILLTMYKNLNYLYQAISLGVKGYLSKDDAVAEIVEAVKEISEGRSYVSTSQARLMAVKKKSEKEIKDTVTAISTLTHMEREVLKLVGNWKTNNEIGETLFISSRTAGNHRTNISSKLNLHGTHSLIKFALENRELF